MGSNICKEIVGHIISNVLIILIYDVRSEIGNWNQLSMNECVGIGHFTLLGIENHDISYSDCITLYAETICLTLGNDNRKYFCGILPSGTNGKEVIIH